MNEMVYETADDGSPKKFRRMTECVIGDQLIGFDVEAAEFELLHSEKTSPPDYFLRCSDPTGEGRLNVLPADAVRQVPAWALD